MAQRVDRMRRAQDQPETFQVYAVRAIEQRLKQDEAAYEAAKPKKAAREPKPAHGLGIRERLEAEDRPAERSSMFRDRAEEDSTEEDRVGDGHRAVTPQITVNVTTGDGGGSSNDPNIRRLAREILQRPKNERREALQAACVELARSTTSQDERQRLAAALDVEIKRQGAEGSGRSTHEQIVDRVRARLGR